MISLTVIIPTKNRPDHLQRALRPLGELNGSSEIIVVDDGSSDRNRYRNQAICNRISGCRYEALECSRGASAARNLGFHLSSGAYLWFLDDDDYATRRTVRDVVRAVSLRSDDWIMLMPRTIVLHGTPIQFDVPADEPDKFERYRRVGIEVTTSCALFPREIITRLRGWDESLLALQDTDLFLRAARIAQFACLETEPIRVDVSAPARITHTFANSQIGKLQFLRKHWGILPIRRRLLYLAQIAGCSPLLRGPRARWRLAQARRRDGPFPARPAMVPVRELQPGGRRAGAARPRRSF